MNQHTEKKQIMIKLKTAPPTAPESSPSEVQSDEVSVERVLPKITWEELTTRIGDYKNVEKYYISYLKYLLKAADKDCAMFDMSELCSSSTISKFQERLSQLTPSYAVTHVRAILKIMKSCSEYTDMDIAAFRQMLSDLSVLQDTKSDNSHVSDESKGKLELLTWDKVAAKMRRIIETGTTSCRRLAQFYMAGYVFYVSEIAPTVILSGSESDYSLDPKTGVMTFVRRKRNVNLTLPMELVSELDLQESGFLFSDRVMSNGVMTYKKAPSNFYKNTFNGQYCPASCQKSYLAWMITHTEDQDNVMLHAEIIGAVNEAKRMLSRYEELLVSGEELDKIEGMLLKV